MCPSVKTSAFPDLLRNSEIIIMPADKGNGTYFENDIAPSFLKMDLLHPLSRHLISFKRKDNSLIMSSPILIAIRECIISHSTRLDPPPLYGYSQNPQA